MPPDHFRRDFGASHQQSRQGCERHHHKQDDQYLGDGEIVDPDNSRNEIPPYPEHDDRYARDHQQGAHHRFGNLRPSGRFLLSGPPIHDETHECDQDHEIGHRHFCGHHPEYPKQRMMGPAHFSGFFKAGHKGVGGHPDAQTHHEHNQHGKDRSSVRSLGARNPVGNAHPKIVIGSEEQHPDEHCLQDKEPGQKSSHEGNAHLLVILVDLSHEPITGEGKGKHAEHADEVSDVAHPIIMFPFLPAGRQEIADAGIGAANKPAQYDVGNESMNVNRPPRGIPHGRPCSLNRRPVTHDNGAGLERRPGVGDDHDKQGKDVQQESQKKMKGLLVSLHGVPSVPVQVQRDGFQQEQQAVHDEGREKDIGQIRHELRVQPDQKEEQDAPEQRRCGIGGRQQLGKLFCQFVVAGFLGLPSDDFANPGKDRHAQHEPCKE